MGDKPGEALKELEGREDDLGAAIGRRPGELVEDPGLGRGEGGSRAECVETFEGEGGPRTVTQEALYAGTVLALDADGGVQGGSRFFTGHT